MNRTERMLSELGWAQKRMGAFLGVNQSTVCALARNKGETGPVSRLLDLLERAIRSGRVHRGVEPDQALTALAEAVSAASISPPERTDGAMSGFDALAHYLGACLETYLALPPDSEYHRGFLAALCAIARKGVLAAEDSRLLACEKLLEPKSQEQMRKEVQEMFFFPDGSSISSRVMDRLQERYAAEPEFEPTRQDIGEMYREIVRSLPRPGAGK